MAVLVIALLVWLLVFNNGGGTTDNTTTPEREWILAADQVRLTRARTASATLNAPAAAGAFVAVSGADAAEASVRLDSGLRQPLRSLALSTVECQQRRSQWPQRPPVEMPDIGSNSRRHHAPMTLSVTATSLKPLGDRIVVRPTPREEMTKSGIVLPDTAKERPQEGTILSIGPGTHPR